MGTNIVQVARAFGAGQVIAIDVSDDKLAPMPGYGATAVVNSATHDAREEVLALTGGKGVDVAFEALGVPATWTTALDVLADGGRMVPIGLGAGVQTAEVEINRTVRRSQSILGSYGARTRQDLPAGRRPGRAGRHQLQGRRLPPLPPRRGRRRLRGAARSSDPGPGRGRYESVRPR